MKPATETLGSEFMNSSRRMVLVAAVLCLAGGAWSRADAQGLHLGKKTFDGGAGTIRSIDVAEVVQQQSLMVLPPAASPTPVRPGPGATASPVAEQARLREASGTLEDAFKRKNTSLSKEFTRQLVAALKARNVDARVVQGQKPRKDAVGTRMELGPLDSTADAVLYTVLRFAGYKEDAAGMVPMVGVDAYLFDKSGKLIYRQVFNQGYALVKGPDVASLPVAVQAKFANRSALGAGADAAADGLVQLAAPVAARIAEDITK